MRIYASKYLGHGIRVGVSENVGRRAARPTHPQAPRPSQRSTGPSAPRKPRTVPNLAMAGTAGSGTPYVALRPTALTPLAWGSAAAFVLGFVFPPLFVLAGLLLIAMLVTSVCWELTRRRVARECKAAPPTVGGPARAAYDQRAARIAELDAEIAAGCVEYERVAARTAAVSERRAREIATRAARRHT